MKSGHNFCVLFIKDVHCEDITFMVPSLLLLLLIIADFAYFNQALSRSNLLFGRPGDTLPAGILSLDILNKLSASILVTCWSHSLLATHSLIGWIPQDTLICWLLIVSIFLIYFQICLVFDVSALVSRSEER